MRSALQRRSARTHRAREIQRETPQGRIRTEALAQERSAALRKEESAEESTGAAARNPRAREIRRETPQGRICTEALAQERSTALCKEPPRQGDPEGDAARKKSQENPQGRPQGILRARGDPEGDAARKNLYGSARTGEIRSTPQGRIRRGIHGGVPQGNYLHRSDPKERAQDPHECARTGEIRSTPQGRIRRGIHGGVPQGNYLHRSDPKERAGRIRTNALAQEGPADP